MERVAAGRGEKLFLHAVVNGDAKVDQTVTDNSTNEGNRQCVAFSGGLRAREVGDAHAMAQAGKQLDSNSNFRCCVVG